MSTVDRGPMYCRFHGTDVCYAGLDIGEHRLEHGRWRHPDGLSEKGYWAFGDEATQ